MANAKISQLPVVTDVTGADLTVVVQGGVTSQTTIDDSFANRTIASANLTAPILGTPVSGNLTNCTAYPTSSLTGNISLTTQVTGTLPVANGGTGITSLGTGVATWLGTPSSANLASAVTGETGSGALVFGTGPTISAPVLTLKSYTVATLPAAASSTGIVAYVTDATTPAVGSTVVGGGAAAAMVWSNGANWTVTGV